MIEYIIIERISDKKTIVERLTEVVNYHLQLGWQLQGGASFSPWGASGTLMAGYQTMIKEKNNE